MPLSSLLNLPEDDRGWEQFAFNNQDILSKIRQEIQAITGNIEDIIITSNGSHYTSAPNVTITDIKGAGKGATAIGTYTVSGGFYSLGAEITNEGSGYLEPIVSLSGGGGSGGTAVALYRQVTNLPQYQTYPIDYKNPQNFQFWLIQNAQAHDDFNSFLNLQSSDLTGVDIENQKQLEAWTYLNYKELYSACLALGIS